VPGHLQSKNAFVGEAEVRDTGKFLLAGAWEPSHKSAGLAKEP
jgi:hypothetical protein